MFMIVSFLFFQALQYRESRLLKTEGIEISTMPPKGVRSAGD